MKELKMETLLITCSWWYGVAQILKPKINFSKQWTFSSVTLKLVHELEQQCWFSYITWVLPLPSFLVFNGKTLSYLLHPSTCCHGFSALLIAFLAFICILVVTVQNLNKNHNTNSLSTVSFLQSSFVVSKDFSSSPLQPVSWSCFI